MMPIGLSSLTGSMATSSLCPLGSAAAAAAAAAARMVVVSFRQSLLPVSRDGEGRCNIIFQLSSNHYISSTGWYGACTLISALVISKQVLKAAVILMHEHSKSASKALWLIIRASKAVGKHCNCKH